MKTFEQYLTEQGHTEQTVKSYLYQVDVFLQSNPKAEDYRYKDVMNCLAEQAQVYENRNYRSTILASMKRYYDYLIDIGKRNDHPCRRIFLKGANRGRQIIVNDLFSSAELEQLMVFINDRRGHHPKKLILKNQVIISFLIYQALHPGEIAELNLSNIDLDKGTIYLKGSKKVARRHLEIHAKQYRLFDRYLHESRPDLLGENTDCKAFVVGKWGTPTTVEDVNHLTGTLKPFYPDRVLNPQTIRQSVIANWLNEKKLPLEQVQLFAGHKWISTTAAYRQTSIEEQREMINKFHPLG